MRRIITVACSVVIALFAANSSAGQLESTLSNELRGAWAVLHVEVYSNCTGTYHNNDVQAAGVSSRADRRFAPGELVKVDKINLKRAQLDLFLSLSEPVLMSRIDGPFELFDEQSCRVQLQVAVPRDVIKAGDPQPILDRLDDLMNLYPSLASAQDSGAWNQRQREAYPDDYEITLARHAVWQAEQLNQAVAARAADARAQAVRVTDRIDDDPDYLKGFAAGVDAMRDWHETNCDTLVGANFSTVKDSPGGSDHSRSWKRGFDDGQELVFNVVLSDLLEGCFVPVPPLPPEAT